MICHCTSQSQAIWLLGKVRNRLAECKLELNLEKTKIVYCKDDRRKGNASNVKFDFLGFTFQPRSVKTSKGRLFVGFNLVARKQPRQCVMKFVVGESICAVTKASKIFRVCLIRNSGAGSITTAGFIGPNFTRI